MTTLDLNVVAKSVAGEIVKKYPALSYKEAYDISLMAFDAEGAEMERLGLLSEDVPNEMK